MTEFKKLLGRRIQALRKQKGWNQDQLAEVSGLSVKYISEIEREVANPSLESLLGLAEAFDFPLPQLLDWDHEVSRANLEAELKDLIDSLDDQQLKTVYRLIKAVIQ